MANRKISDLVALTTPASGDYLPIVDISEAAAADKNKRITIEELMRGVPDGTAAAPGISFDGDNTGIYRPGADQIAISTNGTGRLFVDASGKVGVGSTAPSANLTVVGDAATTAQGIHILRNGYTAIGRFGYQSTLGSELWLTNNYNPTTGAADSGEGGSLCFASNGETRFITANIERARIDNSGRLGVGTASPLSVLDVQTNAAERRSIRFSGTGISNAEIHCTESGGYNRSLSIGGQEIGFFTDTGGATTRSERARIDSSGRLLVGTASNSGGALLQINGDRIRVGTAKTPASATDTGTAGEICWDANYVYVCTATNTWKRSALSTW
jgi:hypothetical protein